MSELDTIYVGDCVETMRSWPDAFIHCCVTSPPYWGLRDYGVDGQLGLEKTPEEYVEKMVAIFREVKRVMRHDGVLWMNMGDSYSNDTKWGGKSGGKNYTSAAGGYQGQRRRVATGLKAKDLVGMPWRVAFALQADGWWLRSDVIWHKPNPMPESVNGWRWEQHRVKVKGGDRGKEPQRIGSFEDRPQQDHDGREFKPSSKWIDCQGCPKCEKNDGLVLRKGSWRCTKAHEMVFMLTKSPQYFCDSEAVREGVRKSAVIERPDFPRKSLIGGQNRGFQEPAVEQPDVVVPATNGNGGLLSSSIRLAATLLQGVKFKKYLRLLPLDTKVRQEGFGNSRGPRRVSIPVLRRASSYAARFANGNISAKEFLGQMHRLYVALPDGDDLKETWIRACPILATDALIHANSNAAVRVHDTGQIGKLDFFHGTPPNEHDNTYATSSSSRNKRDVWSIPTAPFSEAHFATFPPKLIDPCIKAGTSEKGCCPECGSQWARIIQKKMPPTRPTNSRTVPGTQKFGGFSRERFDEPIQSTTLGWRPTCECNAGGPEPCIVFDPFGGSGTTGLVAQGLGRRFLLCELSPDYCQMAVERIRDQAPMFSSVSIAGGRCDAD